MTHPVVAVGVESPVTAELVSENVSVFSANDRPGCLRLLFEKRPQLVVIDVSGVHLDGPALCQLIREICDTPILCLAEGDAPNKIVECLEAGADSCVRKPIGRLELSARMAALIHTAAPPDDFDSGRVVVGDLTIDLNARRVTNRGAVVALARREFDLLGALAERPGCVVSHSELLSRIWGHEYRNDTHYVRLYIGYLRQKLEDAPHRPRHILTERGVGYRLGSDLSTASPVLPAADAAQYVPNIRPARGHTMDREAAPHDGI